MDGVAPPGSILVETVFQEGALGVTLRRRNTDGVVYVHEIVPESQAVNLDILVSDELWSVGSSIIGTIALDKEGWMALVQYIKSAPRPLTMVWRRPEKRESPVPETQTQSNTQINVAIEQSVPAPPVNVQNTAQDLGPKIVEPIVQESACEAIPVNAEEKAIMEDILSKLFAKEKEKTSLVSSIIGTKKNANAIVYDGKPISLAPYTLPPYNGRQLLKVGEMTIVGGKSSSVSLQHPNKIFILLTDVLIICVSYPGNVLLVEDAINLQICKLRTYLVPPASRVDTDTPAVFDIIWPGGYLQTGFMTEEGKEEWLQDLFKCISSSVGYLHDVIGWKHQHMLGTIHSAVILRDEQLLRDIISYCENQLLDFRILDSLDDSGYTPMHYAVMHRFTNMTKILHDASASVEIPDRNGLTSLHWSCMLLDDDALAILTTHVVDIDVRDYDDRTPLFLVLVEGRDKGCQVNIPAMKKCAERLLSLHAEPNVNDHRGYTLLHYVSASWYYELIELLIQYKADSMAVDYENGMTALHLAARGIPLRKKISEVTKIMTPSEVNRSQIDSLEEIYIDAAIPTLKSLLQAGLRPNYKDSNGKTPLHHIFENADTMWGASLGYGVITLLTYGARMDDSSQCQGLRSKLSIDFDTIMETRINAGIVDADGVSVASFDPVRETAVQQVATDKEKALPVCVMCGINFTLFRRQHHCRLCNALCCDECSKRRAVIQGKESRSCDSCYNRVQSLIEAKQRLRGSLNLSYLPNSTQSPLASTSTMKTDKSKLFGSSSASPKPVNAPSSDSKARSVSSVSQTMSTMNEAHQRLAERGEKLNQLNDKSAELSNTASDFAKLAKQLKDQQRSSWF